MKKEYSDFKGLFRQTKTLTFKLLPVGETEKNMVSDKIVECAKETCHRGRFYLTTE